jgi:5'-nucleotidase
VAPLGEQSGKGGSLTTGGTLDIERQLDDGDNDVWSVAGTPVDSVRVGLGLILASDRPDLVVSGSNFGQNQGRTVASSSGTVGAAYAATTYLGGLPAIDVSVEIDLAEARLTPPFPSTIAAFADAGAFTARLVGELQEHCKHGRLLPEFHQLHINYPAVPAASIAGIAFTDNAVTGGLDISYSDPDGAVAAGEGKIVLGASIADPATFEDDVLELSQDKIAIVVFDGDMQARRDAERQVQRALRDLAPTP